MTTQYSGAAERTSSGKDQKPTATSSAQTLANEIFARLNDANRNVAFEDLQGYLAEAARTLVRPAAVTEAAALACLRDLSSDQRETLLMHLRGLTCAQIAQRQARTHQAVLKDLTRAYVRFRFSLDPMDQSDTQTPVDGTPPPGDGK